MRYRLDPDLIARADAASVALGKRPLTAKQIQAVELYDGVNYGYRSVALEMGVARETAREMVQEGLRKLERVLAP